MGIGLGNRDARALLCSNVTLEALGHLAGTQIADKGRLRLLGANLLEDFPLSVFLENDNRGFLAEFQTTGACNIDLSTRELGKILRALCIFSAVLPTADFKSVFHIGLDGRRVS